ncbi:hypothetical protein EC991_007157 [Linnemannia zychae]|nr:hypothetical protein EC991_007157 [Linnemannia zychae]
MPTGNTNIGSHSKRDRLSTKTWHASKHSSRLPIDLTSTGVSSKGKAKRVRRFAKRQSPHTSMTRVFKMSDLAVRPVLTGTDASLSESGIQEVGGTRSKYDSLVSVDVGSKDELLFKQLCLALSSTSNKDNDHDGKDGSLSPPSSGLSRRNSTNNITSGVSCTSNGAGGHFGFLALGPLYSSSRGGSVSSKTQLTSSRKTVINTTKAGKEEGKERYEVDVTTTKTTSTCMSKQEDLNMMAYLSPLDFEPDEFAPLQLDDGDFLPVFDDMSCTDDWQQLLRGVVSELSPSVQLLQSSDMMGFNFEGCDGQLLAGQYDHSTMISGAVGMADELGSTALSPSTIPWVNGYDTSHVALFQTTQQLSPGPVLSSTGLVVGQLLSP